MYVGQHAFEERALRLKPKDKARIAQRIREAAAGLFRARGIAAVTLDELMGASGLTRGAFYAHYRSKDALVAEVLRHEHPLLSMLAAREGADAEALRVQMRRIFRDYLTPAHLPAIYEGCTLASLTGEAARGGAAQREAFEAAVEAILTEMARGRPGPDRARHLAALLRASGAVNAAMACRREAMRAEILAGAWRDVEPAL